VTGFTLSSDLAEKIRAVVHSTVRVAPASEKLSAFELCAQRVFGLIGVELPQQEAIDRLQAIADAHGVVDTFGDDAVLDVMARALADPADEVDDDDDDARAPEFSDEAIALAFAEEHRDRLRYVAAWARWQLWSGMRWASDETLRSFDLARHACRNAAVRCEQPKAAASIASARTVAAVERLARADRRIAATTGQWDSDPWSLNTPGGIFDLRSGVAKPHDATDYCSKITRVAPDSSCDISTWCAFLDRVTGRDEALIAFLRRMLGYGLTGLIREHALFFLYGTGANGKSTFLTAAAGAMGDYHRTAAIETFTASANERHPTDLAALRGARMVTAVETEEGRRWAESKIKSLTGGDEIAARFMRQDFFTFTPVLKLVIAGNHKPSLDSVDEAIRRRFHLVPFTITVPPEERDDRLGEKLAAEQPGILRWMIEGCAEWQRVGLSPPPAVLSATADYLEAEDAIGAWIEIAGDRDANAFETTGALFASWRKHAAAGGEWVGSMRKFSQRLEDRASAIGLSKARDKEGRRGFRGLRLPALATEVVDERRGGGR
jgi:putative DNA primase/helicase